MPRLVTIRIFDNYLKAELARIRLESEGIQCFILDANMAATNWFYSIFNSIKLCVEQSDAQKALEILNSAEPLDEADFPHSRVVTGQADTAVEKCPYCGSRDIDTQKFSRTAFFLSILFFYVPFLWPVKRWRCLNCWRSWKRKK